MGSGFYIIMAAQFFSSLADNALLVAAIALLMQADAPSWLTPYLKFFFVISYVVLAPYVGAFADRLFAVDDGELQLVLDRESFDVRPSLAFAFAA